MLRLVGLGWGERHRALGDESDFVDHVARMLVHHDLDHRFYEYPGFFLYLLAPGQWLTGAPYNAFPAYLAGRLLVVGFGVASVGLVYLLGLRLRDRSTGLVAALLLAVSPVDVETAHMVRTDVPLETFLLLGLLALLLVGPRLRADAWAGLALGAATAIKWSGALLVPSILARRLLVPGPRLRGLLLAGGLSVVTFAALSPYTFLHPRSATQGALVQLRYHYEGRVDAPGVSENLLGYLGVLYRDLGPFLLGACLAGLVVARRDWRRLAPMALFPVVVVAVFSTAELRYDRFLVPISGVLALLAALGIVGRARGRTFATTALALLCAAWPLWGSVQVARAFRRPSTADRALDWVDSRARPGARLVTTVRFLGLDTGRYEVLRPRRLDEWTLRAALDNDFVIARRDELPAAVAGLRRVGTLLPAHPVEGPALLMLEPELPPEVAFDEIRLDPAWLRTSGASSHGLELCDGDVETVFRSPPGEGDAWIELDLAEPVALTRIELALAAGVIHPPKVRLLVAAEDGHWRTLAAANSRVAPARQLAINGPRSQRWLPLHPVPARRYRLVLSRRVGADWAIAEVKVARPGLPLTAAR